jgi:hypothetical protein
MGTREILSVEQEQQKDGRKFEKVGQMNDD